MFKAAPFAALALVAGSLTPQTALAQGPASLPTAAGMGRGYGELAPAGAGPVDYSRRDAAGNLVIVNGGRDPLPGGSGFPGWGPPGQTAVAIGNQITVDASGSWNTIIIDAVQTNTGDVVATTGATAISAKND